MRLARLGVCAALLVLGSTAVAQQPSPKDQILGKWAMSEKKEGVEIKATFDFAKDKATAVLSFQMGENKPEEVTIVAAYKWLPGDDTIEMTTTPPGAKEAQTEKVKIKVNDKELSMSGKDGKELKFSRVK